MTDSNKPTNDRMPKGQQWIGMGMAMGIAIGAGIGVAIGVAIGIILSRRNA